MELKVNSLRDKLLSKEFVVGTFLEIPSPQLVEVFGLAGFDFVIIDGELGQGRYVDPIFSSARHRNRQPTRG